MSSRPCGRYLAAMVDEDPGQQALEAKAEKAPLEIEDDEDDDEEDYPAHQSTPSTSNG